MAVGLTLGYVSLGSSPFESGWFNDTAVEGGVVGNQTLDEVEYELGTEAFSSGVSITLGTGIFALMVSSVAFAGILGITVMGSGLAEFSIMAIFRWASCYGLWFIFSVSAVALFMTIPFFGLPLYFLLTFFYSFGVLETMRG